MMLRFGRHPVTARNLPDLHAVLRRVVFLHQLVEDFTNTSAAALAMLLRFLLRVGERLIRFCRMAVVLDYLHRQWSLGRLRSELCRNLVCDDREYLLEYDRFFGSVNNGFDFCFKAHRLLVKHSRGGICVSTIQHTTAKKSFISSRPERPHLHPSRLRNSRAS